VFQNSDGKSLLSIKGDDARTNVYGSLNVLGDTICIGKTCINEAKLAQMIQKTA
jgi:hypothetical protein